MFKRVLIANRGEIALRTLRACKELGIETVSVYSEADAESMHVQLADDAICIGPTASADSYLKIANIISAAEVTDVDAIHPGYGFLAENAHFAEICENCKIKFIGPTPDNIRKMGDKAVARKTMKKAGVPVTPGSEDIVKDEKAALKIGKKIGYPALIKAVAGGGGKGMRIAHDEAEFKHALMAARSEAERAFGNPDVYIEKYIKVARHIEVQIIADHHGHIVHLGERDCSLQRRHQKLLEEAPSPALSSDLRKKLGRAAIKAASAVDYQNAGTIEFLYDEHAGKFYFMEMNTRIQVEHPVTEEVTGIDLIKEQIKIASGEPLSFTQKDIQVKGHAIEFRINAEDPHKDFTPSPGRVEWVNFPGGYRVRVDSHVYSGYMISPYYDSMVGKVIASGTSREEAIARMKRALDECLIEGPATTVPLGKALLKDPTFIEGKYNTHYLEQFMQEGFLNPS
ncbi:MAG: acetyl-CoA carboxylase biotin carboxylase subunit [Kiritimatiellae bacterium]|nr:acetyl-CoA carboxylase biotin carboxylase subunit [Kiritimatiellia bacterium]